jgi:D-alanine transaminase
VCAIRRELIDKRRIWHGWSVRSASFGCARRWDRVSSVMSCRNGQAQSGLDGLVYVQVSRGVARDHGFPPASVKPTLVTAQSLNFARYAALAETGIAVVTRPEARWARCDIKSTGLLANVLAKQAAREAGAFEAWFVDRDGLVTEGASTTAWIVDAKGVLRTRALDHAILPGVTRGEIIPFCRQLGVELSERAFSVEEARNAREAFISAASFGVLPVTRIDGNPVGDGKPGLIAARIGKTYWSSR